jgi:hypothetical protein
VVESFDGSGFKRKPLAAARLAAARPFVERARQEGRRLQQLKSAGCAREALRGSGNVSPWRAQ